MPPELMLPQPPPSPPPPHLPTLGIFGNLWNGWKPETLIPNKKINLVKFRHARERSFSPSVRRQGGESLFRVLKIMLPFF